METSAVGFVAMVSVRMAPPTGLRVRASKKPVKDLLVGILRMQPRRLLVRTSLSPPRLVFQEPGRSASSLPVRVSAEPMVRRRYAPPCQTIRLYPSPDFLPIPVDFFAFSVSIALKLSIHEVILPVLEIECYKRGILRHFMKERKVTCMDIAGMAGVSIGTVLRVINDRPGVSAALIAASSTGDRPKQLPSVAGGGDRPGSVRSASVCSSRFRCRTEAFRTARPAPLRGRWKRWNRRPIV